MKYRPDIEGLRALAVILVIISHLNLTSDLFSGGFIGVDVFFVVSGYLITSLLMNEYSKNARENHGLGWVSLRAFYFRRARRILPTAFLVLLATVITSFVLLNRVKADQTLTEAFFALIFLANWQLISQKSDYFQQGFDQGPLQHFWSLSVEEQFYFFFPTLFMFSVLPHGLTLGKFNLHWRRRLLITVGVITSCSLVWSFIQINSSPLSAYYSSLTRTWEIGIGSFLAISTHNSKLLPSERLNSAISVIGISGVFFSVVLFNSDSAFPGINALLPTLATCCLIYAGISGSSGIVNRILSTRVPVFLGRISYSLYLWHLPILIIFPKYFANHVDQNISQIFLLIPLFLISILTYRFVERPIRVFLPPLKWEERGSVFKNLKLLDINGFNLIFSLLIVGSLTLFVLNANGKMGAEKITELKGVNSTKTTQQIIPMPESQVKINEIDDYQKSLTLWQEALSSGLRITRIPQDLNPLLSAQKGTSKGEWGECLNSLIPGCKSGSVDAKNTALVIGDSYASAIFPMVTNALDKNSWKVEGIFRGQCMIADVVPIINGKTDYQCRDFRKSWISYLATKKPNLIVLADNFEVEFLLENRDLTALNFWETKLSQSLKIISTKSKNVVYFAAPPKVASLKECVGADGSLGPTCFGLPSARSAKRQISANVANVHGVRVIDGREWTCVFQGCPAIVGNTAVTVDGSHYSRQFAMELAPLFKSWLSNVKIVP